MPGIAVSLWDSLPVLSLRSLFRKPIAVVCGVGVLTPAFVRVGSRATYVGALHEKSRRLAEFSGFVLESTGYNWLNSICQATNTTWRCRSWSPFDKSHHEWWPQDYTGVIAWRRTTGECAQVDYRNKVRWKKELGSPTQIPSFVWAWTHSRGSVIVGSIVSPHGCHTWATRRSSWYPLSNATMARCYPRSSTSPQWMVKLRATAWPSSSPRPCEYHVVLWGHGKFLVGPTILGLPCPNHDLVELWLLDSKSRIGSCKLHSIWDRTSTNRYDYIPWGILGTLL